MTFRLTIENQDGASLSDLSERAPEYDLFVGSLGYESRSTFVARQLASRARTKLSPAFNHNRVLSFDENEAWFLDNGFRTEEIEDKDIFKVLIDTLETLQSGQTRGLRIALDISSMTRLRMALSIQALLFREPGGLQLDVYYAPAVFSKHSGEEGPILVRAPLPGFEGWTSEPEQTASLILGLGYEWGVAVGMFEYLEPSSAWAFLPKGSDPRYEDLVRKRNSGLWQLVPPDNVIEYQVLSPYQTLINLESLLHGLRATTRPMLVPLGPKIFTFCALVAALLHSPDVSVWRVSADVARNPVDRVADGNLCLLRINSSESVPESISDTDTAALEKI